MMQVVRNVCRSTKSKEVVPGSHYFIQSNIFLDVLTPLTNFNLTKPAWFVPVVWHHFKFAYLHMSTKASSKSMSLKTTSLSVSLICQTSHCGHLGWSQLFLVSHELTSLIRPKPLLSNLVFHCSLSNTSQVNEYNNTFFTVLLAW